MPWSTRQQVVLAIVPKVSSVLSLGGSFWILTEVLTDKSRLPKRKHPYHRLLLGMAVYDILESIWNFASTWAIPRGTPGVWHPLGTTATCTAQGFFLTLSVAVPIYNAFLSLYYVMVICYGIDDQKIAKCAEPCMHLVAFGWAFFTAVYSLVMGLLNNANLWCWIAPLPAGCLDSRRYGDQANCTRGDNAWIYRWVFYFAPLWFCIFFATVCTILVYRKVQKYDRITLKYRRPEISFHRCNSRSASNGSPGVSGASVASSNASLDGIRNDDSQNGDMSARFDEMGDNNSAFLSTTLGQIDEREADAYAEDTKRWDLKSMFTRWKLRQQMFREDNPRTAEVFQQALWYLGVFYITHVWSTTNRTIQLLNNGRTYYPIVVIHSFFDPLQGFLNFLVYQRPRYLRFRKVNPGMSRIDAMRRTVQLSIYTGGDEWVRRSIRRSSSQWWRNLGSASRLFSSSRQVSLGEVCVSNTKSSRQREGISSVSGISEIERESKLADSVSVEVGPSEESHGVSNILPTLSAQDSECETNPQLPGKHDPQECDEDDEPKRTMPKLEKVPDEYDTGGDTLSGDSSKDFHELTTR